MKTERKKIGLPTKEQLEFAEKINSEVRFLKGQQYRKFLKYKDLDPDEVYAFFKEKYKLVKMRKYDNINEIIIRFNGTICVMINDYYTELIRFYDDENKGVITLSEMFDNIGIYGNKLRYQKRQIGSTSHGFKNVPYYGS